VEERPVLGDGRLPVSDDIRRATRLSRAVWTAAAVLAVCSRLTRRG
jgi:adenosylcobinamide-phosphate synthase